MSETKAYIYDPKTRQSKTLDFNNPDNDMQRQMADVLLKRTCNCSPSPAVLKMLYLNEQIFVPGELRAIVQELVDQVITPDQAKTRIETWRDSIPA